MFTKREMQALPKLFDFEDRLVRFAGETSFFVEEFIDSYTADYYKHQLIRSSGSSVLNYGEAQATITDKDFLHKMSIVVKELKESRSCLKVLAYTKIGNLVTNKILSDECEELIAIGFTMIKKRQNRNPNKP